MSKHVLYSLLLLLIVSSCTLRKLPPEEPEASPQPSEESKESLQDNTNAYRLGAFINEQPYSDQPAADQPVSIIVRIEKESGEGSEEGAPCRLAAWKLSEGLEGGKLHIPNGDPVYAATKLEVGRRNILVLHLPDITALQATPELTLEVELPEKTQKQLKVALSKVVFDKAKVAIANLPETIEQLKRTVAQARAACTKRAIEDATYEKNKLLRTLNGLKHAITLCSDSEGNQAQDLQHQLDRYKRDIEDADTGINVAQIAVDIAKKFKRGINDPHQVTSLTPLQEAIVNNDEQGVTLLLLHPDIDLYKRKTKEPLYYARLVEENYLFPPLTLACERAIWLELDFAVSFRIIEALLKAGACVVQEGEEPSPYEDLKFVIDEGCSHRKYEAKAYRLKTLLDRYNGWRFRD